MCLLLIAYRQFDDVPVVLASNREEYFGRGSLPPQIHEGSARMVCGLDRTAGGTWLGVNSHGLLVAVTNRPYMPMRQPRSRGLLCRELLECHSTSEAIEQAAAEMRQGVYAGVNVALLDPQRAAVVQNHPELLTRELNPGLHTLSAGDLDDPGDPRQSLARALVAQADPDSADAFIRAAQDILARGPREGIGPSIVLRGEERGTVSSTIVALPRDRQRACYLYAADAPDRAAYDDYSELLRSVLASAVPE